MNALQRKKLIQMQKKKQKELEKLRALKLKSLTLKQKQALAKKIRALQEWKEIKEVQQKTKIEEKPVKRQWAASKQATTRTNEKRAPTRITRTKPTETKVRQEETTRRKLIPLKTRAKQERKVKITQSPARKTRSPLILRKNKIKTKTPTKREKKTQPKTPIKPKQAREKQALAPKTARKARQQRKKNGLLQNLFSRKTKTTQAQPQKTETKKQHPITQTIKKSFTTYDLGAQPVLGTRFLEWLEKRKQKKRRVKAVKEKQKTTRKAEEKEKSLQQEKKEEKQNKIIKQEAEEKMQKLIEQGFEIEKTKKLSAEEQIKLYTNLKELQEYKLPINEIIKNLPTEQLPQTIQKITQAKKELKKRGINSKKYIEAIGEVVKKELKDEELYEFINKTKETAIELNKKGVNPDNYLKEMCDIPIFSLEGRTLSRTLDINMELAKRGRDPSTFVFTISQVVRKNLKGKTLMKTLDSALELAKEGIEPSEYIGTISKAVGAKLEKEEVDKLTNELKRIAIESKGKEVNISEFLWKLGNRIKETGLKGETLDKALEISRELVKQGRYPRYVEVMVSAIEGGLKGEILDRAQEVSLELARKGINPDVYIWAIGWAVKNGFKGKRLHRFMDRVRKEALNLKKKGIEPKPFIEAAGEAAGKGFRGRVLSKILNDSIELLKEGVEPESYVYSTFKATQLKFKKEELYKFMNKTKGDTIELKRKGADAEEYLGDVWEIEIAASAKWETREFKVDKEGFYKIVEGEVNKEEFYKIMDFTKEIYLKNEEGIEKTKKVIKLLSAEALDKFFSLKPVTASVIAEQATKGWATHETTITRRIARALQPEIMTVLNSNIMQRSMNRVRRFITPIMENGKTAKQIRELIRKKIEAEGKLSKKQAKELPGIVQKLTLINMMEETPRLEELNFKLLNQQLEQQVIKLGVERYGQAFEKKYEQLKKEKAEDRIFTVLNAVKHLESNYEGRYWEKEQKILNNILEKWLEGKQSLKKWKYKDLEKLKVPEEIQQSWKQTTTINKKIKPNQTTDKNEILKRLNESLNELTPEQQKKLKKEYEKIQQLIKEEKYGEAQAKAQKLSKQVKQLNEDAARHLNQSAGLMTQAQTKETELEITDSLRLNQWISAGEVFGTCQSYTSNGEYNRALVSFLADGTKKIIGVYDKETGEMKARGVLHLVKNEKGQWALYLDDIYSHIPNGEQEIQKFAEQKAQQLQLEITNNPAEVYGKAPYTYMNNKGGLTQQKQMEKLLQSEFR